MTSGSSTTCGARWKSSDSIVANNTFAHAGLSCWPNCEIDPDDTGQWPDDCDECFLQIHRNIKVGQEMVVTYLTEVETAWNLSKRRTHIWENWGFHCECEKCNKEAASETCECAKCKGVLH